MLLILLFLQPIDMLNISVYSFMNVFTVNVLKFLFSFWSEMVCLFLLEFAKCLSE